MFCRWIYCAAILVLAYSPIILAGPANDDFANATDIPTVPAFITSNNTGATAQTGEPKHYIFSNPTRSVWWKWTPATATGITVSTEDTFNFGAVLAVYTGPQLAALTQLAADE